MCAKRFQTFMQWWVDVDCGHCYDRMWACMVRNSLCMLLRFSLGWNGRDAMLRFRQAKSFLSNFCFLAFCVVEGLGRPTFMACAPAQTIFPCVQMKFVKAERCLPSLYVLWDWGKIPVRKTLANVVGAVPQAANGFCCCHCSLHCHYRQLDY